ncbi:MAG: redoxin domain-containing protein [Campylobacter sp.]|nr:redoxin domain-containing protein [Campylobacter sp.]
MKKALKLSIIIFLGLFIVNCSDEEVKNDLVFKEYKPGDKIILNSVNGGSKTLIRKENGFIIEGEEDKVVMFDFFGTFCAPCKEEALDLSKLWRDNTEHFTILGLSHFENVSNETVKKFADDYGAYYFLSNESANDRIIAQILHDIDYQNMEQLPFKVVLKKGKYQELSDYWNENKKTKFYLGKVPIKLIQEDLERIYKD